MASDDKRATLRAGEALQKLAQSDPKFAEALQRLKTHGDAYREVCEEHDREFEAEYGSPYPNSLEEWEELACMAGVSGERLLGDDWSPDRVLSCIQGTLRRQKEAKRAETREASAAEPQEALPEASDPSPPVTEPFSDDYRAYWANQTGLTQTEVAEKLSETLGRPVAQGQVSRMLSRVEKWIAAGNTVPSIEALPQLAEKPMSMDSRTIDIGARLDHRPEHLREKRTSIENDGWDK